MTQAKGTKRKRYDSVQEMVHDLSEDQAFADRVAKRIEERNIIRHLMAMRASLGMSQRDVADKMGCSQSRISKLENGKDDDLRIGDFHGYADALGLQMMILLAKKGRRPIAERIRYHTSALRRLFRELASLVGNDVTMKQGMQKVISQSTISLQSTMGLAAALCNLVEQSVLTPPQADSDTPAPIQIEVQEDEPASAHSCEEEDAFCAEEDAVGCPA